METKFLLFIISAILSDDIASLAKIVKKILITQKGNNYVVKEEEFGIILESLIQIKNKTLDKVITKEGEVDNPELLKAGEEQILKEAMTSPKLIKVTRLFINTIYPKDWLNLCRFLMQQGRYQDAKMFFDGYESVFDEISLLSLDWLQGSASLYALMDFTEQAEEKLAQYLANVYAITDYQLQGVSREKLIGNYHANLGALYSKEGKFHDALQEVKKATTIFPPDSEERYQHTNNLILMYLENGRLNDAEIELKNLENIYKEISLEMRDKYYVLFLQNWGYLHIEKRELDLAEDKLLDAGEAARVLLECSANYNLQQYAHDLFVIGSFYNLIGEQGIDSAILFISKALEIVENIFDYDKNNPMIIGYKKSLDNVKTKKASY